MSMNPMRKYGKETKIKLFFIFALCVIAAGCTYVYLIYEGYLLLNNPSKSKYPIRGVDVSHYQGNIDWKVMEKNDIQFAYIKATEGSSHTDMKFHENWANIKSTQLKAGAYHFFSFDSPGVTQAENFIDQVESFEGMLPPVVDVEYYGDKPVNPPPYDSVRQELTVYLDIVENYYGQLPVIYSTEEVWQKYLKGNFDRYPLWIRNVMTKPREDAVWTFWQYTNRARLNGFSGDETFIDVNVFYGDQEDWETFTSSSSSFGAATSE